MKNLAFYCFAFLLIVSACAKDAGDSTPPQLLSMTTTGTGDVITELVLNYSESVQSPGAADLTVMAGTTPLSVNITVKGEKVVVQTADGKAFPTAVALTVNCISIKDLAGNADATKPVKILTIADITAPTLVSYTPKDKTMGVVGTTDIVLTYSEPVKVGADGITVIAADTKVSISVTVSGNTLTIKKTDGKPYPEGAIIAVSCVSVADLSGNTDNTKPLFQFMIFDQTPPTLVSVTPANKATGISPSTEIVFNFSEPIQAPSGADQVNVVEIPNPGETVPARSMTITFTGTKLTLTAKDGKPFLSNHDVYAFVTNVKDLSGNSLVGKCETWFTTSK